MIRTINEYKIYVVENNFKLFNTLDTINEASWDDNVYIPRIEQEIKDDLEQLVGLDGLKAVGNIVNDKVKKYINDALDKINKLSDNKKLLLFKVLMSSFFAFCTLPQMISTIHTWATKNNVPTEIVQQFDTEINSIYKNNNTTNTSNVETTVDKYNAPTEYSDALVDFIKAEEGCELTAYNIGDGKITVGYGHAEDIGTGMKDGTVITQQQADDFLIQDLKEAQDGLDNIFNEWKSEGIKIKITQGQYDAMISMIFNSGIGHFRESNFIQELKNNNMDKAQEEINNLNNEDFYAKYPGVKTRRALETAIFASNAYDVVNQLA